MSSRARSSIPIGLTAIASLLLAAGPAAAQDVQDQKLLVTAFIGDVCTVTAASLDFGSGINLQQSTDAAGQIDIECATDATVGVQLDGGQKPLAGAGQRSMSGGGEDLIYTLYKNATRSTPWEENGEVVTTITGGFGSVPVYGTVPAQPNGHAPGLHTDEVTITLNFQ